MTQAVLLGGLFIGVLSALPVVNIANCCCLWVVGGGALTVYLARQADPHHPAGLLAGARAGFRAGLVGAVVWLLLSTAIDPVVAPLQQRAADMLLRNATDMPPDVRTWLESIAEQASAPLRLVVGFVAQLVVAAPFAALGGLLGAATLGRDQTPGGPES